MRRLLLTGALVLILLFSATFWVWATGPFRTAVSPQDEALTAPVGQEAISDVELNRLPIGAFGPGVYIQFDEPSHNLDQAHGYPVEGGHARYGWDGLEPNFDGDYRFNETILPWVQQEAARGKKVGIGFVTYNGPNTGIKVPSWLWARDANVRLLNTVRTSGEWYVLNYLNRTYVTEYKELIEAFASWVASTPVVRNNLAWVEIGSGQFGENQPAAKYTDPLEYQFYSTVAGGSGWTSAQWVAHCNELTDIYRNAFNNVGLTAMPIFTNIAPSFEAAWERDTISDYAVSKGVGLKNAGLIPDHNNGAVQYGPLIRNWDNPSRVPISWEVYGPVWPGVTGSYYYWVILAGLPKHPDNFLTTRDVFTDPDPLYRASTEFASQYTGVTLDTTPSVWVTLRDTMRVGRWDNAEKGNYSFWLYQDDFTSGRTVTETNIYDDNTKTVKNRLAQPVYNSALGSGKEGWYVRRTNQGDTNPYMWFKIDDGYIYGGPTEATITVTYFDKGTDKWRLRYDSMTGDKDATPDGSANAWVQKTNSSTWKKATFTITDGRFRNYQSGAHDFFIDCMNDGDEWIHMVDVRKAGGSAPTPTATSIAPPTPSPTPSPTPTSGSGTTVQIQLRAGPNMVAYGGPSRPVAEALSSINGLYTKVFAAVYEWDAGQSKYQLIWKRYLVGAPAQFNTITNLEPWQGYWIYVSQDCMWTWQK